MSNRLSSNGAYAPTTIPRTQPQREDFPGTPDSGGSSTQQIAETVGAVITKSPAITLLVALAVGVAIGMLVKRS